MIGVAVITTLWSTKGGAGVSVVAAARALSLGRSGTPTVVVDLCGDLPGVFGAATPPGPGIAEWLGSDGPPEAIDRIGVDVAPGVRLVHRGGGRLLPARAADLTAALSQRAGEVVVDAGCLCTAGGEHAAGEGGTADDRSDGEEVADHLRLAGRSLLVTRACYLALRRATLRGVPAADGIVLVEEPGRSLDSRDVASVLGTPVVARVRWDPAVARAVDAGVLAGRMPSALRSARLEAA